MPIELGNIHSHGAVHIYEMQVNWLNYAVVTLHHKRLCLGNWRKIFLRKYLHAYQTVYQGSVIKLCRLPTIPFGRNLSSHRSWRWLFLAPCCVGRLHSGCEKAPGSTGVLSGSVNNCEAGDRDTPKGREDVHHNGLDYLKWYQIHCEVFTQFFKSRECPDLWYSSSCIKLN